MRKDALTFGLLVGTRGFFSSELARVGREELVDQVQKLGHRAIILPPDATPTGAVETLDDARKCAALFGQHRDEIDGIVIALPNFGDELAIAHTLHRAKLGVPILVQASADALDKVDLAHRRDAFCGKLSVCNNLGQYGLPFTDTATHTVAVGSPAFARDLEFFAGVCRVVSGLRNARIGAIGARPAPFQTVRVSEKLLQASGITVVPVDLSEIIAAAGQVDAHSARARQVLADMKAYGRVPASVQDVDVKFERQVRLFIAVEDWLQANAVDTAAFLCWTSIQRNYGCATCLTMSMLGERLLPCACEVDVAGALAMYALALASGKPSALVDWNNNYGDDHHKCVVQHCSNFPRSFLGGDVEVSTLDVLGNALGEAGCFGAIKGKAAAGPMTYLRFSTDDRHGRIRGYVGQGDLTDDPFNMSGGIGVCAIPHLQKLLKYICKQGFEHHCAMVRSHCADIIQEAVTTYLGWDLYVHES